MALDARCADCKNAILFVREDLSEFYVCDIYKITVIQNKDLADRYVMPVIGCEKKVNK